MSKHTPGPWHWESDAVKGDPMGRVRYQVTALGKTVTRVYYSSYEGGPTNAEADARLIAAAPDLLEALQSIAECCDEHYAARDYASRQTEIRGIARAAIVKATGEDA